MAKKPKQDVQDGIIERGDAPPPEPPIRGVPKRQDKSGGGGSPGAQKPYIDPRDKRKKG